MICHLGRTHSIKLIMQFALTDKTQEPTPISWTKTLNLPTEDTKVASEIMEFTATAHHPRIGAATKTPYRQLWLTWPEPARSTLTRQHMLETAEDALKALEAHKTQTIILAYAQAKTPFVHAIYSRIDPETGRSLPKTNEATKIRQWAKSYEDRYPTPPLLQIPAPTYREKLAAAANASLKRTITETPAIKPNHEQER